MGEGPRARARSARVKPRRAKPRERRRREARRIGLGGILKYRRQAAALALALALGALAFPSYPYALSALLVLICCAYGFWLGLLGSIGYLVANLVQLQYTTAVILFAPEWSWLALAVVGLGLELVDWQPRVRGIGARLFKWRYPLLFALFFLLRFYPELVNWPWLLGNDTPEYVAALKDYVYYGPKIFATTNWYGSEQFLPPLLYAILYPLALAVDPWWIFKSWPSLIHASTVLLAYYYLEKVRGWEWWRALAASTLFAVWPTALNISLGLHRNALGLLFVMALLIDLERGKSLRSLLWALLASAAHQATALISLVMLFAYAVAKRKAILLAALAPVALIAYFYAVQIRIGVPTKVNYEALVDFVALFWPLLLALRPFKSVPLAAFLGLGVILVAILPVETWRVVGLSTMPVAAYAANRNPKWALALLTSLGLAIYVHYVDFPPFVFLPSDKVFPTTSMAMLSAYAERYALDVGRWVDEHDEYKYVLPTYVWVYTHVVKRDMSNVVGGLGYGDDRVLKIVYGLAKRKAEVVFALPIDSEELEKYRERLITEELYKSGPFVVVRVLGVRG